VTICDLPTVAALFVQKGGVYFDLPGVDPWDEARDARLYAGPHPVVAHPPCARWGRWAGPTRGEDGGCFRAGLAAVQKFGGVLEHPQASSAFVEYGLGRPQRFAGWTESPAGGFVCYVEQGHYGHRARKATWLYYCGVRNPPPLVLGPSTAKIIPRPGRDLERERRIGAVQGMCRKERAATPPVFRDALLTLARNTRP
jgi:hypothetical protein